MRGKRNRFKIVPSQKARAGAAGKTRRGTIARLNAIETLRARGRRNTTRAVPFSFRETAVVSRRYYELNEKQVNFVAAKTVESSGYFQLETRRFFIHDNILDSTV